jgi:predicted nucleotidyltransferase
MLHKVPSADISQKGRGGVVIFLRKVLFIGELDMESTVDILDSLRRLKPELATSFNVQEIGMFGSMIRGEQREESDIDILVDLPSEADLLDLIGIGQFLEERLHHKVDVVPKGALRDEIRESVLKEVRYL